MKKRLFTLLMMFLLLVSTSCTNRPLIEFDTETPWLPGLHEITAELQDYQIYLIGETHGVAATYSAEIEIIQYFYHVHGVQDILLEEGYGSAMVLQQYLDSGNMALLLRYMDASQGTAAYTSDYFAFCTSLYEFNMTLPENRRIRVIGVDIEHQYDLSLWYLQQNIPLVQLDDLLNELFSATDPTEIVALIEKILSNKHSYQELMMGFTDDFFLTLDGMLQGQIYYSASAKDSAIRESHFTGNALSAIGCIGSSKALAIFGSAHTGLSKETSVAYQSVGNGILEEFGEQNVTSLVFVYNNCMYRAADNSMGKADTKLGNILAKQTESEGCVIPISTTDTNTHVSRFAESYNYAILIQNSNAATQYEDWGGIDESSAATLD